MHGHEDAWSSAGYAGLHVACGMTIIPGPFGCSCSGRG